MSTIATILTWLPTIKRWWPFIKALITVAEEFKKARGLSDADAIKAASEIQFGFRLPTPEEEQVMFDRGFQKDPNHIFPYVQS